MYSLFASVPHNLIKVVSNHKYTPIFQHDISIHCFVTPTTPYGANTTSV